MGFKDEFIIQWLHQYAYEPQMVYLGVFVMMIASGFGLPLPEEVTIISTAIIAYMGAHPEIYPPPYAGAPVVNGYEAALVLTFSVFFADVLVFSIGRFGGRSIMKRPSFHRFFGGPTMQKVNDFTKKYGSFAAFLFRFLPGIRFPGHIFLGVTHFSYLKFLLIDGFAVLISVPTQVLLVFYFGEGIMSVLKKFKIGLFSIVIIGVLIFAIKKYREFKARALERGQSPAPQDGPTTNS